MSEAATQISVVIPTRGREPRLGFALEALARQSLAPRLFEVIVVRDGDSSPPLVEAPPGLDVRFLTRPGVAGPTAKRNLGWRQAAAPLIAFTDDDCRPDPGWLMALLEAAGDESTFLQGKTEPDPEERYLMPGLARTREILGPSGWFETCNVAYPRALLEHLGGFDEDYGFGGEDTDLAYRAFEAGAEARFVGRARVWHAVIPRSLYGALRDATRWNDLVAVVARHPSLRKSLHRGLFWYPAHERLLLGALGLAGARNRRLPRPLRGLASLLAIPYFDLRVNWRQPTLRRTSLQLLALPAWALVDAVETLSRLPGALRRRILVL